MKMNKTFRFNLFWILPFHDLMIEPNMTNHYLMSMLMFSYHLQERVFECLGHGLSPKQKNNNVVNTELGTGMR